MFSFPVIENEEKQIWKTIKMSNVFIGQFYKMVIHQWRHATFEYFWHFSTHRHSFYDQGFSTMATKFLIPIPIRLWRHLCTTPMSNDDKNKLTSSAKFFWALYWIAVTTPKNRRMGTKLRTRKVILLLYLWWIATECFSVSVSRNNFSIFFFFLTLFYFTFKRN